MCFLEALRKSGLELTLIETPHLFLENQYSSKCIIYLEIVTTQYYEKHQIIF